MASPTPVLPEVGSTIVPPGRNSPLASAASTIRSAMRSFTEPPGLKYSTLATTNGARPAASLSNATSGVLPTRSTSDRETCTLQSVRAGPTMEGSSRSAPQWAVRERACTTEVEGGEVVSWTPPRGVTRGAAYGGGGLGMVGTLGALGYALIKLEAKLARRAVPPITAAPVADGRYGNSDGIPLRLVMLGDSGAAGFGAETPAETPGALLAGVLAEAGRSVTLEVLAVTGARSADLDGQITLALADRRARPDMAVVLIGANDVTHWNPPRRAAADLTAAVTRLRGAGVRVVVATCPDLGALGFVPQPLRASAR